MDNLLLPIVSLLGILGLTVAGVVVKVRKAQNTPLGQLIEKARANFVTPESVEQATESILRKFGVPVLFVEWASALVVSLITDAPVFRQASNEHLNSVVADVFSKKTTAEAKMLVSKHLPDQYVSDSFAKKRVANTILKQVDIRTAVAKKVGL